MARILYALLVGIDDYPLPIPSLSGCLNDLAAMEAFLIERCAGELFALDLRTLRNAQATRQAVIDGFQEHLGRAGEDDVALFYYCGHGSQERTPPEFWYLEPDRLDETLVCYDSRLPGNYDLADKELAKLLAHVARNNPHLVVILDSCHSGSGTRAPSEFSQVSVRRAPTDARVRPIETFLMTPEEGKTLSATSLADYGGNGWLTLPYGRHIVIAACHEDEEAKEMTAGGRPFGVFSHFLIETLSNAGPILTYRDAIKRVTARVRANAARQIPLIEATHPGDLDRPFLGGAIRPHVPYFTVSYDKVEGWLIDGGALHGIPESTGTESTTLVMFPLSTQMDSVRSLDQAVGEARVIQRQSGRSNVMVSLKTGQPDKETTYKAVITRLPLPPLRLQIVGDVPAATILRASVANAGPGGTPSLFVVEAGEAPDLQLIARDSGYRIMRVADERPLAIDIEGVSASSAQQAVERVEHIARWLRILELRNPVTRLDPDSVQLQLYWLSLSGKEQLVDTESGGELRFSYEGFDGQRIPPRFKLRLVNRSPKRLYCVLLDMPETYSVSSNLLEGSGVWLDPGADAWARVNGSVVIRGTVPNEFAQQGLTEIKDTLKLIVSTEECDATQLDQGDLTVRLDLERATRRSAGSMSSLSQLMARLQTRHFGDAARDTVGDWTTSELSVTIVCPRDAVVVPQEGESVELGPNLRLQGHSGLRAVARLSTVATTSRDPDLEALPTLPPWLVDDPSIVLPFEFSAGRGGEAGLSVLELDDVDSQSAATVTPISPLMLHLRGTLGPGEHVLPIGFDGEFFLPLGYATPIDDRSIGITLVRLPEPLINSRSLTGSIRIFFKKVVSSYLGTAYPYPVLAAVDCDRAGTLHYTVESSEIRSRIQAAQRILLYVHGIIGDTRAMASSAFVPQVAAAPSITRVKDRYDLILAFDYENLNTPIDQTARDLGERLGAVGLGSDHAKTLHIAAHSMGGLVARWFIEREKGKGVVQHLIMLGTPNGGSPWPAIEDWLVTLLGIGLNGLAYVPWPPTVLGHLMTALSRIGAHAASYQNSIEVALQQMNPNSEFLRTLQQSRDPGIGYSIIAGNTSIVTAALDDSDGKGVQMERLLQRLRPRHLLHVAASLAFFGVANDIAVSVQATEDVPVTRSPAAKVREIACDHLSYFGTDEVLRELATILD